MCPDNLMLVLDNVFVKKLSNKQCISENQMKIQMYGKMFKFTLMTMTDNRQILIRKDHLKASSTDFLDID